MPAGPPERVDLLDLKLMPAWLKEPADARSYEHYEGESEERPRGRPGHGRGPRPAQGKGRGPRDARTGDRNRDRGRPGRDRGKGRPDQKGGPRPQFRRDDRPRQSDDHERAEREVQALAANVTVRFLPHPPVLENVALQVQSNPVAYSVFGLARLFLDKPERYDVQLTAQPGFSLYQLGDNPAVSANQAFLESGAFRVALNDFYLVETTQTEPIKGNFTTVARCRASGTLLGPTNHHAYQPRLRSLYEQRFSRRMSFPEYQRQIEIVNDPAVVEQWKEEARNVTTFTALKEEPPAKFSNVGEAERHFRQKHLPGLVRPVTEMTMDGLTSRKLPDRGLRRLIEDAWARETRSPSQMMHEISNRFRADGLQIFRHRKGMLFVISVRVRPFAHETAGVSPQVHAILQTIGGQAGIGRKELADKLLVEVAAEEMEARKIALASDLRWLISEGYVIEFNDGSLDLPRAKVKPVGEKAPEAKAEKAAASAPPKDLSERSVVSGTENAGPHLSPLPAGEEGNASVSESPAAEEQTTSPPPSSA